MVEPSPSSPAASISRKRKRQECCGYDCEFVAPLPEAFQAECLICLQILKEPCLISCPCGKEFCRECIERIKRESKPCPLCNKTDFTFLRHHGSERYLKAQEVWCSRKKDGCDWKGKLGEFEEHLNHDPPPDQQLTGCQFVEVECKHGCGECFQRRHIAPHQAEKCPKRLFTCEFCQEYKAAFEEVTKSHYPQCSKYPVTCPNGCKSDSFERQELENHLKDACPLAQVDCPLHYAGCDVKLLQKDMPEHVQDTATHFPLLVGYLLKESQEKQRLEEELKALKKDVCELKLALRSLPIDVLVKCNKGSSVVHVQPFYTHSHGYRMCVRVRPNDAFGLERRFHVSIYVCLVKGLFDDDLKWPFRGKVTIQIVNQAGDHSHVEKTITYDEDTPDGSAGRPTDKEQTKTGWGVHRFLAHSDLDYNHAKNTQYMKDNVIVVRIKNVKC